MQSSKVILLKKKIYIYDLNNNRLCFNKLLKYKKCYYKVKLTILSISISKAQTPESLILVIE